MGKIYIHKNKINGKVYVGQTQKEDVTSRWGKNGYKYNKQTKFYNVILKYGWDNFEHIVIEDNIDNNKLTEREQYWYEYYDSINNGYNTYEPIRCISLSEEQIEQIRENSINAWTEERKKEQSERMKTIWENRTEEEKQKIIAKTTAALRKAAPPKGEKNPMYGTHRIGLEAARRKSVECIETGQKFNTIKEAAEWLGPVGQKSHISQVCKGTRNYCGIHPITKEKLHWRYIEDNEKI